MAEFSKLAITDKGKELMAKLILGSGSIRFTKICTSTEQYVISQIEDITDLTGKQQTSLVSKVTRYDENTIKVETAFTNAELRDGYYIRALGVYALDPDEGEILYGAAVETSGNYYMPPYNGSAVSGAYIKLFISVENAENVSLEVDAAAIATVGDIQELRKLISSIPEYKADGGIMLDENTFKHTNETDPADIGKVSGTKVIKYGETFTLPWIEYDKNGHICSNGQSEYDIEINNASADENGLMTASDKIKLDSMVFEESDSDIMIDTYYPVQLGDMKLYVQSYEISRAMKINYQELADNLTMPISGGFYPTFLKLIGVILKSECPHPDLIFCGHTSQSDQAEYSFSIDEISVSGAMIKDFKTKNNADSQYIKCEISLYCNTSDAIEETEGE